jgi:hypothetical protein
VPDTLFAKLRERLDGEQLVELTHHIALENLRGASTWPSTSRQRGFSEGMVCAVPDIASLRDRSRDS